MQMQRGSDPGCDFNQSWQAWDQTQSLQQTWLGQRRCVQHSQGCSSTLSPKFSRVATGWMLCFCLKNVPCRVSCCPSGRRTVSRTCQTGCVMHQYSNLDTVGWLLTLPMLKPGVVHITCESTWLWRQGTSIAVSITVGLCSQFSSQATSAFAVFWTMPLLHFLRYM